MGTKKVELISMAEFGKRCGGISGEAISKAEKKGDVYRDLKTKLINPNHPKNKAYQDRPSRQRSKATGVEEEEEVGNIERDITKLPEWKLNESELKRLRLMGQIQKQNLENEIKRSEYISTELVGRFLAELAAIDEKQIPNIATLAAPMVISLVGVEESWIPGIQAVVVEKAWEVIGQKKIMISKFLEGLKE